MRLHQGGTGVILAPVDQVEHLLGGMPDQHRFSTTAMGEGFPDPVKWRILMDAAGMSITVNKKPFTTTAVEEYEAGLASKAGR